MASTRIGCRRRKYVPSTHRKATLHTRMVLLGISYPVFVISVFSAGSIWKKLYLPVAYIVEIMRIY